MRTVTNGRKTRKVLRLRRLVGVSLILLAVLVWNVPGFVRAANADPFAGGSFSSGVNWQINSINDSDTEFALSLYGTGSTPDFTSSTALWNDLEGISAADIKRVYIYDGVTSLGNYIFYNLTGLESISTSDSLINFGTDAIRHTDDVTVYLYSAGSGDDWVASVTSNDPIINDMITNNTITFTGGDLPDPMRTPGPATPTPTLNPTATPAATATPTPTVTPTSAATPTPTSRATATPTTRATATPTARATATPQTTPTATPNVVTPNPTAYNGSLIYTYNNPGGGVYGSGSYAPYTYKEPKLGDGDAFRLILVALLMVSGIIVLISSLPKRSAGI